MSDKHLFDLIYDFWLCFDMEVHMFVFLVRRIGGTLAGTSLTIRGFFPTVCLCEETFESIRFSNIRS